jgi:hypothetical protein
MPLTLVLPEGPALRRLAGALASATRPEGAAGILTHGLSLSVGRYFALFPWRGEKLRPVVALPRLERDTVGAYFAAFNWKGLPLSSDLLQQEDTHQGGTPAATEPMNGTWPGPESPSSGPQPEKMDRFFSNLFD